MPRLPLRLTACLLLSCLPCSAQDDASTRLYDIRGLDKDAIHGQLGVDLRLPIGTTLLDSFEPEWPDISLEERKGIGALGWHWDDQLRECIGPAWRDAEVVDLDGFLEVTASPDVHGETARVLRDLEALSLRSVEVELAVIPADLLPREQSPILTARQAEALIAQVDPITQDRAVARLGQRVVLGGEDRSAILYDYDIEVATLHQGAADPVISVARDGTTVGAIVDELLDGRLFVRVWGRDATRLPANEIQLAVLDEATLTLPRSECALQVGSAVLEDGGGLLLGQDWNTCGFWLIRFRRIPSTEPPLCAVPVGLQLATPIASRSRWLLGTPPTGGLWAPDTNLETPTGMFDHYSLIEQVLPEHTRTEDKGAILFGGHLYLCGDLAYIGKVRRQLEALTELIDDTVTVELRFDLVDPGGARALLRDKTRTETLAGELGHRVLGACRAGDVLTITAGEEQLYLMDYNTEIAGPGRTADDPVVHPLFEGLTFACRTFSTKTGKLDVETRLGLQLSTKEMAEGEVTFWRSTWPETGVDLPRGRVQLPSLTNGDAYERQHIEPGTWHLIANETLAGLDRCLVAVLRVTPVD